MMNKPGKTCAQTIPCDLSWLGTHHTVFVADRPCVRTAPLRVAREDNLGKLETGN